LPPKVLTSVYLSPALVAGLESLKIRTAVSKGESIRRAVAEYLEKQGAFEAGKADR
jgi:hypothetical protein